MDKCPKAREDNELGFGEDSFKSCDAWPKWSHITMQIIFPLWVSFYSFDELITRIQYWESFGCLQGYTLVPAESTYHWSIITRIMLIRKLIHGTYHRCKILINHYNMLQYILSSMQWKRDITLYSSWRYLTLKSRTL